MVFDISVKLSNSTSHRDAMYTHWGAILNRCNFSEWSKYWSTSLHILFVRHNLIIYVRLVHFHIFFYYRSLQDITPRKMTINRYMMGKFIPRLNRLDAEIATSHEGTVTTFLQAHSQHAGHNIRFKTHLRFQVSWPKGNFQTCENNLVHRNQEYCHWR